MCWNCGIGIMEVVTDNEGHNLLRCGICGATANASDEEYQPKHWRGLPLPVVKGGK